MSIESIITSIRALPPFPNEQFVHRLFNKTRHSGSISLLADKLSSADPYGEDPDSPLIDTVNASQYLNLFGEQAVVQALASLDGNTDKYNLRDCLNLSNAQIASKNVMTNVTSLLYGEHVNWFLRSQNLPNLAQLAQGPGFADEFAKQLQEPHFVQSEIYTDMVKHTHDYSLSLLFICEYLHHGPGVVPHIDGDFMSSPSGKVLKNWISQLSALSQTTSKNVVTFCSKAASMVHATTNQGNIEPQKLVGLARSIFSDTSLKEISLAGDEAFGKVVPFSRDALLSFSNVVSGLDSADVDEWESITAMNMSLWGNTESDWKSAVIAHTTFSTSSTKETHTDDGSQFGRGFLIGISAGFADRQTWETTTLTGQAVADWINQGRSTYGNLFTKDAPSVVDVSSHTSVSSPIVHSCFIAGTQIATDKGPISIEAVNEGTRVLTDATSMSYGIVSDEDVVTPLSVPLLVGINGQKPFFTPGHVFHTSSGLRAVAPVAARRENPYINVGKLEPGHVLYRLAADGKSYDHVKVKSLQIHRSNKKFVYGVHLREGQRSYHADGYLVVMNYPEITVKSIARMLSTFSKQDRIHMLRRIKELEPLFQKFGVSMMSAVLTKELQGEKRREAARPSHVRHQRTSNLQHIRRTYQLTPLGENSMPGYILPTLALHEGAILLDGVVQPRVSIDPSTRQIRWTREASGHGYEHGYVELVDQCFTGRGVVVLSHDSDLEDLPRRGSRKLIGFTVAKANVHVNKSTTLLNHKKVQRVHPAAAPSPPAHAPLPARPLTHLHQTLLAINAAASVSASSPALADPGTIDGEDYYDLIVDKDVWDKGVVKTTPSNPTPLGQVALATYHTDGAAGLSVPIITIPHLDQLRDEINKTRTLSTQIGPLYSSVIEQDNNSNLVGTVTLDEAALIVDLSDKLTDDVIASSLGLTFKTKLNSTFILPILFQTLVVSFNWNFSALEGAAYAYDANMRGCVGERHKVVSSDTASSLTFAVRSANADAMATSVPHSNLASPSTLASPALVTLNLAAEVPLTLDALTGISGYNEVSVHSTSQTLLQNMMYFHMNDDDRSKFLQFPKPTDLPIELAQNLDHGLATWIHDVYAPAYITFMLSQVVNKDVNWRNNLTGDEKNKVWYWWSGSGDTCLAKLKEFNELNAITATAAMQKLYGSTLTPYLRDGKTWAKKMVDGLKNDHALGALLKSPINGGVNIINKYCNILLFLDPLGNNADDLFTAVVTYVNAKNIQTPYIGLDDPDAGKSRKWLFDAMAELGTLALDNSSSLDPGIRESLQNDLTNLQKEYGDLSALTNLQKMQHMLTLSEEFLGNMSKWMSAIGAGLNVFKGFSGFQRAAAVYDKVLSKLPDAETKKGVMLKGIGTIAMAAMYIGVSVNSFMHWDILDPTQRATLILSTLQMAVDIAGRSIEVFNNYKQWKGKEAPSPNQSVDGSVIDQGSGEVLSSEKTIAALEKEAEQDFGSMGIRGSVASRAQEYGLPESALPVENEEKFNVPLDEDPKAPLPEGVPPAGTKAARNYNTSANWLKAANIVLGIGLTVSMSLDLKKHWDDMNLVGKILSTVQVAVQGLTVLCDTTILIGELAADTEFALDATVLFALPGVGSVLAVIGVVVAVVLMFLDTSAKKDPPLTPVETFLQDVAHPTIAKWNAPPAISLRYDVPGSAKANASPATLTFKVSNPSPQVVNLAQTRFTFEGGLDDACLFTNTTMDVATTKINGSVYADPSALVSGTLTTNPRGEAVVSYDFEITGTKNDTNKLGQLILKSKESFTVAWTGIVNKTGFTTLQIIESLENGDHCRLLKTIQRA